MHVRWAADGQTRHRCETIFLDTRSSARINNLVEPRTEEEVSLKGAGSLAPGNARETDTSPILNRHKNWTKKKGIEAARHMQCMWVGLPTEKHMEVHVLISGRSHDLASRTDLAESIRERKKFGPAPKRQVTHKNVRQTADITTTCTSFPARVPGKCARGAK